jgi:hypothetical protein
VPVRSALWRAAVSISLLAAVLLSVGVGTADAKKKKKDKSSPYIVSAVTQDADNDGQIDGILVTYSEKVRIAKVTKGKGKMTKKKKAKAKKFVTWSVKSRKLGTAKLTTGGKSVLVPVNEVGADSADRPQIIYVRAPKGATGVLDKAGNQALTAAIKAKDGVAPSLLSARTVDSNTNGQVDSIRLQFSETIASADASKISIGGHSVTAVAAEADAVKVSVDERGIDTSSVPAVTAASGAAKDGGDNPAPARSISAADGAPPAIIDAATGDTDANGKLDKMTLTFSEVILHAAEPGSGSLAVAGFTTSSVSGASGSTVTVNFSESSGFNTGALPTVSSLAAGSQVTDSLGNALGASSYSSVRDGAGPALVIARTRDSDADGRIDGLTATFSEPISYTSGSTVFSTTPSATTAMGALTATVTASGAVATVTVTEIGSGFNTNLPTVSPAVPLPITYTHPGAGGALDAAGNPAATATVQATDGAGPAIVYAETVDANVDATIDAMNIGFSEPISQLTGSPLTVASGLRVVTSATKITGGSSSDPYYGGIRLELTPQSTSDGADKPTVDYTGSTGNRAIDANGNEVPGTSAQAFTGTVDKVRPVMRSVSTLDANPTDGFVDTLHTTWSEPVSTDGSPDVTMIPTSGPAGYAPPTTTGTGATANNYTVDIPLTPSASPDRDVQMRSRYLGTPNLDGVTDQATSPNEAVATPNPGLDSTSVCSDTSEISAQDDSVASSDATGLATVDGEHLATLCAVDADFYSFSATTGQTQKILFAPSAEVFDYAGRTVAFNPFVVTDPSSGVVVTTNSFVDGVGWTASFTAPATGTYHLRVRDTNLPIADYGYCVSRTNSGLAPTCSLRQGDLTITEVLKDVPSGVTLYGPYVEVKNTSGLAITSDDIAANLSLRVGADTCPISKRGDTPATIAAGESIFISAVSNPTQTNDFGCPGMPAINYSLPISINATVGNGEIDSVNFTGATVPRWYSVQLKSPTTYETSAGNDNVAEAWCVSSDILGTPGNINSLCDEFNINEVRFAPSTSDRDGDVYIEVKGNGSLTPASTLLGGWRLRVRPQGETGRFYELPAAANPNAKGIYVLADSQAAANTEVPFYSVQSSDVRTSASTDGRDLDSYLRADKPVTVHLLKPNLANPFTCVVTAIDTLGYVPTPVGSMSVADNDGTCGGGYRIQYFKPTDGYQLGDTIQRNLNGPWANDNHSDFCARSPYTPLAENTDCLTQQ